jgi:hypothetical protein
MRIPSRRRYRALGLLALGISFAPLARAELFRCEQPGGRVIYTDSATKCAGAAPHEPRGAVQTIAAPVPAQSAPSAPPPRAAPKTRASMEAARAAEWRQKKRDAEEALGLLGVREEDLAPFLRICNRGGTLYNERDNGLRRRVSCTQLRDEISDLQAQSAKLRAYLDHKLDADCRRAGCLPGWLR